MLNMEELLDNNIWYGLQIHIKMYIKIIYLSVCLLSVYLSISLYRYTVHQ